MKDKIRIGIIFGGRSGEHEVSVRSARSVIEAGDAQKEEGVTLAVTKEGGAVALARGVGGSAAGGDEAEAFRLGERRRAGPDDRRRPVAPRASAARRRRRGGEAAAA